MGLQTTNLRAADPIFSIPRSFSSAAKSPRPLSREELCASCCFTGAWQRAQPLILSRQCANRLRRSLTPSSGCKFRSSAVSKKQTRKIHGTNSQGRVSQDEMGSLISRSLDLERSDRQTCASVLNCKRSTCVSPDKPLFFLSQMGVSFE